MTRKDTSIGDTHSVNSSNTVGLNPAAESCKSSNTNIPCSINDSSVKIDLKSKKRLPVFLLGNIQSFGNSARTDKTTEIEGLLEENQVEIGTFTETWLSNDTRDSIKFNGYNIFHLIRENVLRVSGGISIVVDSNIPANRIDLKVPEYLECLWISVRPKWLPRTVSNIVICGVYYPGSGSLYAPNQGDMISHLIESIHKLYKRYSCPLFVIMGDFNDLNVDEICDACKLKQVVSIPTRNQAILDLILTNDSNNLYKDPITLPNIGGSDHLSVLYEPIMLNDEIISKKKIFIRKFTKSAILEFGSWITKFSWVELMSIDDVNLKISYFTNIMWIMIDKFSH